MSYFSAMVGISMLRDVSCIGTTKRDKNTLTDQRLKLHLGYHAAG